MLFYIKLLYKRTRALRVQETVIEKFATGFSLLTRSSTLNLFRKVNWPGEVFKGIFLELKNLPKHHLSLPMSIELFSHAVQFFELLVNIFTAFVIAKNNSE